MKKTNALLPLTMLVASLMQGCSSGTQESEPSLQPSSPPWSEGEWYKPTSKTTWQWQLQGVLNSNYDVKLYDIDLFDNDKATIKKLQSEGKKVICYMSAGSYEAWRSDAQSFPQESLGKELDGWEGERWLDIRDEKIFEIMKSRLELAKEKGCDGVEPDNIAGYQNDTGFSLTAQNQLDYNARLANKARELGLAIGLKNDPHQAKTLEPYFDFALTEQCNIFGECAYFDIFIEKNKPLFDAEYAKKYVNNLEGAREKLCQDMKKRDFRTLVLPLGLDDTFRYSCD